MKLREVTDRLRTYDGVIARRFRLVLLVLGSLAAALITHVAIDLLGDVLLAHDAYDDLAHGSRQTGGIAIAIFFVLTSLLAIRAAFRQARSNEAALRTLLRHAVPHCMWRHSLAVTALSLALVAAMEACDAALAGRPIGDVVALFGGSLGLAIAVATSVSVSVVSIVRVVVARLTRLQGVIVAIVAAFMRIVFSERSLALYTRRASRPSLARIGLRGRIAGERAPPYFLRSSFS